MKTTNDAPGLRRNRSRSELSALHADVFKAVIAAYVKTRELQPVIASRIDPDPSSRSQKLTATAIEFCIDIEHATEKALANEPVLQKAWFALALEEPVDPEIERRVIERCGRVYFARRLAPWLYWRPNRYPQARRAA